MSNAEQATTAWLVWNKYALLATIVSKAQLHLSLQMVSQATCARKVLGVPQEQFPPVQPPCVSLAKKIRTLERKRLQSALIALTLKIVRERGQSTQPPKRAKLDSSAMQLVRPRPLQVCTHLRA